MLFDEGVLWPLIIFLISVQFSPGPNNLFFFAAGTARQFSTAYALLGAIVVTLGAMQFVFAFGLSGLLQALPMLETFLKLCSSGFLLYLSWKLWTTPPQSPPPILRPWQGALFQMINPKIYGLIATSYQFLPHSTGLTKASILAILVMSLCFASGMLWILLGRWVEPWLRSTETRRVFLRVSALCLVLIIPMLW